jgi:hypothetical protein
MAKTTAVTAKGLARHLDLSHQRIGQLVDEKVIGRLPDGRYDQDECRVRYLTFLREQGRRAHQSEEARRLFDAKARAVEITNLRKEGELAPVQEAMAFVQECLGAFRSDVTGLAANVTRDVAVRRRIEDRLNDIFAASAARFEREAAKLRAAAK